MGPGLGPGRLCLVGTLQESRRSAIMSSLAAGRVTVGTRGCPAYVLYTVEAVGSKTGPR